MVPFILTHGDRWGPSKRLPNDGGQVRHRSLVRHSGKARTASDKVNLLLSFELGILVDDHRQHEGPGSRCSLCVSVSDTENPCLRTE